MKIEEILKQPEGRKIEFKETMPSKTDLCKTAVAFANDAGGEIFIGIKDNPRKVIGLPEEKLIEIEEKISNIIHDNCYPVITIREVIRNAVIHRDYSLKGKDIKIAIFDDKIEITSPGKLMPTIDFNDMESGQSDIRNRTLAPGIQKTWLHRTVGKWATTNCRRIKKVSGYRNEM